MEQHILYSQADAYNKSSTKGNLELEAVQIGKTCSTIITVEQLEQRKKDFSVTPVEKAGISEISEPHKDSTVVLIIDRSMENVVSEGENESKTSNLGFKETLFITETAKDIQGTISPEIRQNLKKNSFVVIERSIAFNKIGNTDYFSKTIDKKKIMVNKDKFPEKSNCKEEKRLRNMSTVDLQKSMAGENDSHLITK